MQNYLLKRQQTFVEDWEYPDKYMGDLFAMEDIEGVAVSMIAGERDGLCPPSRARAQADRIGTMANFITIEGKGHGVASRGETFFNIITAELTDETPDTMQTADVRLTDE